MVVPAGLIVPPALAEAAIEYVVGADEPVGFTEFDSSDQAPQLPVFLAETSKV